MSTRFTCLALLLAAAGATLAFGSSSAEAAPGAPTVSSSWADKVSSTSANLHALVDSGELATTYRFEYITEAGLEANLSAVPPRDPFAGASKLPSGTEAPLTSAEVIQHVGGLAPFTAYRFRAVAKNSAGIDPGRASPLRTDEPSPVFSLPDSRGWEMVSPIDKNGGQIQGFAQNFGGDVLQAAASGGSVTYSSSSSFGQTAAAPPASQYVSSRGAAGWSTENVSVPILAGAFGEALEGVPYQLFSEDLDRGLLAVPHPCAQTPECPLSYALRQSGGLAELPASEPDLRFAGSSAGLNHLVLSTCAALTGDATEVGGVPGRCDPSQANLYLYSGAALRLLNLLPGQPLGTPGAELASQTAVSSDGGRVYWSEGGDLYLREGDETLPVPGSEGASFQTATPDGAVAFFTKAGDLYRYLRSSQQATDLTPGGEVLGVLGASADGSAVYFEDASGLQLWRSGVTTPVAPEADPANYPPTSGAARVSADGEVLAFLSSASIDGYDNSGLPEVYLYHASSGDLDCVSCDPSGERPLGPAGLPGASPNGSGPLATRLYKPRVLSGDSRRLFFDTFDSLVPQDSNNDSDVYQWEAQGSGSCALPAGCVNLISSGRAEGGASFIDASADGADAFFLTDGSLVPSDPGSVDVYDARIGGGYPLPETPIPCFGDACQPLPPTPEDPTPGTLVSHDPNKKVKFKKPKRPAKHRRHHHNKHHRKDGGR